MDGSVGNPPSQISGFPAGARPTLLVGILPKLPSENNKENSTDESTKSSTAVNDKELEAPQLPDANASLPQNPDYPEDQGPGYLTEDDIPLEIKSLPKGEPEPTEYEDEPELTAPILSSMDTVIGYENTTFDEVSHPPPSSYMLLRNQVAPHREPITGISPITADEAKLSLLQHVSTHCCYGKRAAKDLAISEIVNSMAFHYSLTSFTEERQTSWAYSAYTGGMIDTCMNGPAPGPWEVAIQVPKCFEDSVVHSEIPHTASIKMCPMCSGYGRKKCHRCYGHGYERCNHCMGEVSHETDVHDRCYYCHGHGKKQCWKCNGQGVTLCNSCQSTGQIKCYIKLTVSWSNNKDDQIVETSELPNNLIQTVSGQLVFEEEQARLWSINHFPDDKVNELSSQLIQKHSTNFSNRRVLRQKHQLRVIPIAKILYTWKDHSEHYFVYGNERKVHAPNYPQTCCCGLCVIL